MYSSEFSHVFVWSTLSGYALAVEGNQPVIIIKGEELNVVDSISNDFSLFKPTENATSVWFPALKQFSVEQLLKLNQVIYQASNLPKSVQSRRI